MKRFLALIALICLGQTTSIIAQDTAGEEKKEIPIKIPNINDEETIQFSPTISADGTILIFQSENADGKWQLYQTTKDKNGVWSKPTPISEINDALSFVAGPNLSYDGNTLYYTGFIEGESVTEDIYYSKKEGRYWSKPKRLEGIINMDEAYEGFSSISSDERQMYYMGVNVDYPKDKKTKESCFEIYVSEKSIKGRWQEPERLPPHINTGCVRDPVIMADNRTLLYSALTIGEKQKFNLYQTQKQLDDTWSDPIPLDFVNTEENNLSPTIPASGKTMYFNSQGDLYTIGIPPEYRQFFNTSIVGYVRNNKNGRGLEAEITVRDANNLEPISIMHSNRSGRFNLVLNAGRNYKVEFKREGFLTQYFDYNLYYLDDFIEEFKTVKMRSDADLGIIVFDKPLDKAMPADIKILNSDGTEAASYSISDYESESEKIQLDINKDYTVIASAQNFYSDTLTVNTSKNPNLQLKFYLTPKTIDYTFNVQDVTSKRKLRSKLTLKNENRDEILESYGGGTFALRQGDQYEVLTSGDRGYLLASGKISVPVLEEGAPPPPPVVQEIEVAPITVGANLILNNISFATNSAQLSPGSLLELDRVAEFMNLNPTVTIEISAHSDDVGAAAFNLQLSERRAASVKDYLSKKNVQDNNMVSVGYGETRPRVPNDSEENRALNRRVELQVTAM